MAQFVVPCAPLPVGARRVVDPSLGKPSPCQSVRGQCSTDPPEIRFLRRRYSTSATLGSGGWHSIGTEGSTSSKETSKAYVSKRSRNCSEPRETRWVSLQGDHFQDFGLNGNTCSVTEELGGPSRSEECGRLKTVMVVVEYLFSAIKHGMNYRRARPSRRREQTIHTPIHTSEVGGVGKNARGGGLQALSLG